MVRALLRVYKNKSSKTPFLLHQNTFPYISFSLKIFQKRKEKKKRSQEMKESGSNDYLILKPESATLLDLFLFILPFNFVDIRNLIDCPPAHQNSYKTFPFRWIIVSSILIQKLLLAIAKLLQIYDNIRGNAYSFLSPVFWITKLDCITVFINLISKEENGYKCPHLKKDEVARINKILLLN